MASSRNTMRRNECMSYGGSIRSANNCYSLEFQFDGNIVLYRINNGKVLWASNSQLQQGSKLCMQQDGNLVLYDNLKTPKWSSGTQGNQNAWFVVENNGNAVIYKRNEFDNAVDIWSTGTIDTNCMPFE